MKVCKFGGTSMASADSIKRVADIIKSDVARRYVIVSAPGKRSASDEKVTDMLLRLSREIADGQDYRDTLGRIKNRFLDIIHGLAVDFDIDGELSEIVDRAVNGESEDYVLSRGEYLSARLFALYICARFVDAKDLIVFADDKVVDLDATAVKIRSALLGDDISIIPGFYGCTTSGEIKTFSRGGSDITGAIVAMAINADVYENWTDVDGVYSANPKTDENAHLIERLTYKEMYDLALKGANVLHKDAVYPVERVGIPINVRNTFNPQCEGTYIT